MIRVSVLLSSYNGEKYIAQQIKSIIEQKGFFDLKIIIRDDGSKDNTRNIIKKLQNTIKQTKFHLPITQNHHVLHVSAYASGSLYVCMFIVSIYRCSCSVTKPCPALCDLMDCSTADSSVLYYLPEIAQIHIH